MMLTKSVITTCLDVYAKFPQEIVGYNAIFQAYAWAYHTHCILNKLPANPDALRVRSALFQKYIFVRDHYPKEKAVLFAYHLETQVQQDMVYIMEVLNNLPEEEFLYDVSELIDYGKVVGTIGTFTIG